MDEIADVRPIVRSARRERDVFTEVQDACEQWLAACYAALYAEDEEGVPLEDVDWPDTAGPFCGCETCVVREVLHAARPFFARIVEAETAAKA